MSAPRPKLLCLDPHLPDAARAILDEHLDVTYGPCERDYLLANIPGHDAVWAHFALKIDKAAMDRCPTLRTINTSTTGTDHIDKAEAARRGIRILCIAKDFGLLNSFTATAECNFMLLLNCMRHFRGANRAANAGAWRDGSSRFQGAQLSGLTMGVLGLGRLGRMTAEFAHGFRMKVLGCDVRDVRLPGVENVDFDTLLAQSDAISIHIHMTPENYHLFSRGVFARIKSGAVVTNTSRGDIVDEAALIEALESGRLKAYGADVIHDEWRPDMDQHPLLVYARSHDNVVLTPHIGGATDESVNHARVFSARKLTHYLRTGEELTMPE